VSYPALKGGASPVPPAFTADGFIRELRAGSRQPTPLVKERAMPSPFSGRILLRLVIGNVPCLKTVNVYLSLTAIHPPAKAGSFLTDLDKLFNLKEAY